MTNQLTIVMYHFVRDLANSRYPRIKGLGLDDFRGQLSYIKRNYNVISAEELVAAANSNIQELPPRALLMTFDDGYIDHFMHVFPILDELGLKACFFPPAKAITEAQVLDVNKIHFVLASTTELAPIIAFIFERLDEYREQYGLDGNKAYYNRLSGDSRYDEPDVAFIKRILQRELPEELRQQLIDELFKKHVTSDEKAFSRELYMDLDQLRCLVRQGMYVGSHGYDHYWLNTLPKDAQAREVDLALRFLGGIGAPTQDWIMCYPYGGYNDSLLDVVRSRGCAVGLTTEVDIADLARDNPLTLPRLDTNDLPKSHDATINEWTRRVG